MPKIEEDDGRDHPCAPFISEAPDLYHLVLTDPKLPDAAFKVFYVIFEYGGYIDKPTPLTELAQLANLALDDFHRIAQILRDYSYLDHEYFPRWPQPPKPRYSNITTAPKPLVKSKPQQVEDESYTNLVGFDLDFWRQKCRHKAEFELAVALHLAKPPGLQVEPQYRWSDHPFDFAILRDEKILVLVECDGDSHKEWQQDHQDRFQAFLAATNGIPVLRFSNKRIFKNKSECAKAVFDFCYRTAFPTEQTEDSSTSPS